MKIPRWAPAAVVTVVALLVVTTPVRAQELDWEYIANQLAPAAQQMSDEGLDGSTIRQAARMVEIFEANGVDIGISAAEAREIRDRAFEDREFTREGLQANWQIGSSKARVLAIGYKRVGATCAENKQKADALDKLSLALWGASMFNTAGAGIAAATGAGAILAVPLGFGAVVTGAAGSVAGRLAGAYRGAACTASSWEDLWKPQGTRIIASLAPTRFRMQRSRHGAFGSWLVS